MMVRNFASVARSSLSMIGVSSSTAFFLMPISSSVAGSLLSSLEGEKLSPEEIEGAWYWKLGFLGMPPTGEITSLIGSLLLTQPAAGVLPWLVVGCRRGIALDHLSMSQGYILHSYDVDQDRLKSMIKTTEIKNYDFIADSDELRGKMSNLEPKRKEGSLVIPIDHSFDVKGVGTVILGVVKQGKVSVHDELLILPQGKKVFVKSIQMHDDSADEATSPARVGLALKGISAIDISRGDVICDPGYLSTSTALVKAKFKKNRYFKEEMSETHTYLLAVGLQLKPVKIRFLEDQIELEVLKPLVFSPGQHFVVIKPDASGVRVCGKGEII